MILTCPVSSSSANSPSLQSSFQILSQTCRCFVVSSLIVSTGSHIHSNCYAVRRPRAMSRSPPAQIHLFPDTIHSMTDQRRYERMRIKSSFPGKKSRFCIIFHLPFAASLRLFFSAPIPLQSYRISPTRNSASSVYFGLANIHEDT